MSDLLKVPPSELDAPLPELPPHKHEWRALGFTEKWPPTGWLFCKWCTKVKVVPLKEA